VSPIKEREITWLNRVIMSEKYRYFAEPGRPNTWRLMQPADLATFAAGMPHTWRPSSWVYIDRLSKNQCGAKSSVNQAIIPNIFTATSSEYQR
jgi:hypothetical protein